MASKSKLNQLHFLLVPLMSQSHIIPLTNFAKLLAQRGISVTFVTTPLNALRHRALTDYAMAQNLEMVPLYFPCQEVGLPEGCENVDVLDSGESVRKFYKATEMLRGPLEELFQQLEPKPNCIISTNALPWTQSVADKFQIPRYVFETLSCFVLFSSPKINVLADELDHDETHQPLVLPGTPHQIEYLKAQLPKRSKDHDSIVKQIDQAKGLARGMLVNTFEELEPWYIDQCKSEWKKLWCIGPVSLCNSVVLDRSSRGNTTCIGERSDLLTWLDSMKPKSTIYVCFGSLCHLSFAQIKEIGHGLDEHGLPFIWIIRKQDYTVEVEAWFTEVKFEERLRGRGLVIRGWAPQVLVLSHPSVGGFVTHCGWNSVLEGLSAGLPMITWPMFAEQFFNEKFIVQIVGTGVRVGVEECVNSEENRGFVTKEQLKLAIANLMDEGVEGTRRAYELGNTAYTAVERGSSCLNLTMFIDDVIQQLR